MCIRDRSGPYFDDENVDAYSHDGPGVLTMYNPGAPNCNGSQFMITFSRVEPEVLDGSHVAFGQVVEGWNVLAALEQLGDARQEGLTFQRITVEQCGVVRHGRSATGGGTAASTSVEASASASGKRRARGVRRVTSGGKKTPSRAAKFGAGRALAARFAYA